MQEKRSKEPRSPVDKERAMQHVQLTIRRSWAGQVRDFEGWGGTEVDPEPLVIHDLNGQVLFYEYGIMQGNGVTGTAKASASKIIGAAVPTVEFGPRAWDPGEATRRAKDEVKKLLPKAKVTNTELVCYSYPKIGVRVFLDDPELGSTSAIFDVADLSQITRYGADELEGAAAWSFYHEIAEPRAAEREKVWNLADEELEAARSATPRVFDRGFTERELGDIRPTLLPTPVEPTLVHIEPYSSGVVRYSPRCNTHECFALYGQKTDVYCAVATGQMILDFYRYHYTQDQIAAAMSTGAGGTSNTNQVAGYESLSNNGLDATYDTTANWTEAKAEIAANRPLKSGIPGHARACAGWMRQNYAIIGQSLKRWLKIYDPWPWNSDICKGGRIYWEDWASETHTNFIYVRHQ